MASRRQDTEDEITEADDIADAATFGDAPTRGPRQVSPPYVPADLRTALAMPTTFGPKLFEITAFLAVSTACKVKVLLLTTSLLSTPHLLNSATCSP